MEIPNYDSNDDNQGSYKQLYPFMPKNTFRLLITGPSGSGKTNTLLHMLLKPLIQFDKLYLYAKNLEQGKYQELIKQFDTISQHVGYPVIEYSNDKIIPVGDLDSDSQKVVIFDDFVCDKNQKPLINYFIRGRHKNCSVICLSQSFYKTPKEIRLNCSHFCIYEFPSANEKSLITRELGVSKQQYERATSKPYSFLYLDKPMKQIKKFLWYSIDGSV